MSNDTMNAAFSLVQNTIYDSKVLLEGLKGILPSSFRVIEAVVEPTAAGVYQLVYPGSETDVQLGEGDIVLYSAIVAGDTLVGGTDATLGLALASGGAEVTALVAAVVLADLNSGVANIGVTNGRRVAQATSSFPVITTTGTYTAGTIRAILIVV